MNKFVTPAATVGFCAVSSPYENEYIATMRFEGEAADQMKAIIDKAKEMDGRTNLKVSGLKEEVDPATDKPTGAFSISFKSKASGVKKADGTPWKRELRVVDSKLKPVGETVASGSTLKLSVVRLSTEFRGTNYLKFALNSVQVIDLVEFGGADFDVEDGFTSTTEVAAPAPKPTVAELEDF